jgi:predicted nuclease of restriction endonuclease-like (RecB) superfamily
MRVQDDEPREFHENEAAECGWTKSRLERQIQSAKATSKNSLEIDGFAERLNGGTALRGI